MVEEYPDGDAQFSGASAALDFAVWSLTDQMRAIETTDAKSERALTVAMAVIACSRALLHSS